MAPRTGTSTNGAITLAAALAPRGSTRSAKVPCSSTKGPVGAQ
jgi:hypothetical protein